MDRIVWNHKTLKTVQGFPDFIKKEVGYLIFRLQRGERLLMPHSRPMPSIIKGCHELRIKGANGIYRFFYFTKIKDEIWVFHAFQKKTEKTPIQEILIGQKNLKGMLHEEK